MINKDNEALSQIKSLQQCLSSIYIAVHISLSAYSGILLTGWKTEFEGIFKIFAIEFNRIILLNDVDGARFWEI